jgi:hypothetical protein
MILPGIPGENVFRTRKLIIWGSFKLEPEGSRKLSRTPDPFLSLDPRYYQQPNLGVLIVVTRNGSLSHTVTCEAGAEERFLARFWFGGVGATVLRRWLLWLRRRPLRSVNIFNSYNQDITA